MKELNNIKKNSEEKTNIDEINILLVEDNLGDIRIIQEMIKEIKNSRFNLQVAEDLSTGLEIINMNQIHVIVLDLSLPDSHGIETVKKMLKKEVDAPVIILTGTDDQSLAIEAVKLGSQDYLIKGQISSILLERAIYYAIERFRANKILALSEEKYRNAFNRANFYKDLFTHDMNNILQNILATTELSLEHLNPGELHLSKEILDLTIDQIFRGALLIKNVRKLSQLEDLKLQNHPIELTEILNYSIDQVKKKFPKKKFNLKLESLNKELFVNANDLLKDIFENLLVNAVRHNEDEIIEVTVKISYEKKNEANYIKIEFKDNGIGIEDKWKETIFLRNIEDVQNLSGMGLGLTLVKRIIDSINGKIYVKDRIENDYRKGSNFIIEIPEVL